MSFIDFLYQLDSWVWGMPLIVAVMILGAYYMIRGKFFPFVHFGHTWKNTILEKSDQTSADDSVPSVWLWAAPLVWPIFPVWQLPLRWEGPALFFGCGYGPSLV